MKHFFRIHLLAFWAGLAFFTASGQGQFLILKETLGYIETSGTTYTIGAYETMDGFDADSLSMTSGEIANPAFIASNNISYGYPGCSGNANVSFPANEGDFGFAIEDLDASQITNLIVQFGYRKAIKDFLPSVSLDYWNGTTYVNLPFSFNELPSATNFKWYLSPVVCLPEDAQINGLKLRWTKTGNIACQIDDIVLMGDPLYPVLGLNKTALNEFNVFLGQEEFISQSFTVKGLNLNGSNVVIEAPPGFVLSEQEEGDYFSPLVLEGFDGTQKEIWVRMAENLSPGIYSGQICVSGGNALGVCLNVSGLLVKPFDIPYFNGFRTETELTFAWKQGFTRDSDNVSYYPGLGGYLGFYNYGYVETPEIDLLPHSHLNIGFKLCAGAGSTARLEFTLYYTGGSSQHLFTETAPSTNTFKTINKTITIQNPGTEQKAKIRIVKTGNATTIIRFRDLSIRDLSNWTGNEDSDWANANNWTLGVPGIKSEVLIPPSANNPFISGSGEAFDLSLQENTSLTINPGGKLTVSHALLNLSGSENLVVEDGGSLIHPNAGVPATVKRNIAAANWTDCTDGWHLISAPVENQAIEGGWTPTGPGNDYDFFAWSEPQQLWLNQKESSNEMSRFIPGEGYLVAYQQGGTKTFAGDLTVGDITRTLTLTEGEDFSGWNLLGNPYPSGLRWNHDTNVWGDLQARNINAYAHTWDALAKSYTVVPPGGFIPAGQGFMVQLTGGESADLTLPTAARAHEGPPEDRSAANGWIRLAAFEQDNASKQECLLMINPAATETYQPYWDAHFLQGFAPQFYSLKNDEKLTVFSMPEIDMDQAIPLGFVKNEAGAFRINLLENNTTERLFLYDIKLDNEHVLSLDNPYLFTAETDDDPLRFELRFKSANSTGIERQIQEGAEVYTSGKVLFLKFLVEENGRTLEVFDPGGRRLLAKPLSEGRQHSISLDLEAGLYIVRLRGKRWTVSKKIFVI